MPLQYKGGGNLIPNAGLRMSSRSWQRYWTKSPTRWRVASPSGENMSGRARRTHNLGANAKSPLRRAAKLKTALHYGKAFGNIRGVSAVGPESGSRNVTVAQLLEIMREG
jgi:hypothetical protein